MTPAEMIEEHRRRHNVMAGHYWNDLANQMAAEIKRLKSENRDLSKIRKEFKRHTDDVKAFIVLIDHAMKQREIADRGKHIADLTNKLQFKNDSARRFVLNIDFNGRLLK